MDRYSPIAPAQICVLVLPVGRVERKSFFHLLSRLQEEASVLSLSDVDPHSHDDELLLSPKVFNEGSLVYNYTASVPSEQQQQLSPFELFREPLLVLGVVDGREPQSDGDGDEKELVAAAAHLRERCPRVVHRQLVVLQDTVSSFSGPTDSITRIANAGNPNDPCLKEAICHLSALFLVELSSYTRALQASPSIQTPGQTARSLQKSTIHREHEKRPESGHKTPTQGSEASTPVDESGARSPPARLGSPATSFDQIPSASSIASAIARSDSRASNSSKHGTRASSQDRVSVQGFGSGTSQDRLKQRGKARVGIVIGSIYMMAGQWSEALRILTEHTSKARTFKDSIWHAKGLEYIIVCLLQHAWAGLEFQIPSICSLINERTTSHVQRFSINLPSDFKPTDVVHQGSVRRLSTLLPDLLKFVLGLYRSGEGPLELHFLSVAEATVRFAKLLAILRTAGGELDSDRLDSLVGKQRVNHSAVKPSSSTSLASNLSKAAIADTLSQALPTAEDSLSVADHIAILSGIASVYALVHLDRKKAIILRDVVTRLTAALTKARKLGAAEMGIHPAASLSAETGADVRVGIIEDAGSANRLMAEIARIYGTDFVDDAGARVVACGHGICGGDGMRANILKELAAFCEASSDLYGVLKTSILRLESLGLIGAVGTEQDTRFTTSPTDDMFKATTNISRNIGSSKHSGLSKTQAAYWDTFLLRGIDFLPLEPDRTIIDRAKLRPGAAGVEQDRASGNPLLYDPSANRPGAAARSEQKHQMVKNEAARCTVVLQNPYNLSIEIESLQLVSEGVELRTDLKPFMLEPMRLQQVPLSVFPCSTGDCRITGCRIKIGGCIEQVFPIISKPWSPAAPTLVKDHGQDGRIARENSEGNEHCAGPEYVVISATVVDAQPVLALVGNSLLDSSLMLLDGERKALTITLRNTSSVTASILDIVTVQDILYLQSSPISSKEQLAGGTGSPTEPVSVEPGETRSFDFIANGRAGIPRTEISFYYGGNTHDSQHARKLSIHIDITVNAALQVHLLSILPSSGTIDVDEEACTVSCDIRNAWPKTLSYICSVAGSGDHSGHQTEPPSREGVLAPGVVERIYLPMKRLHPDLVPAGDAKVISKALLNALRIDWSGDGHSGTVALSNYELQMEGLEFLIASSLNVELEFVDVDKYASVKAGSFVTLRARLIKRTTTNEPLLVQLSTQKSNLTDPIPDDKRLSIAGATSKSVPPFPKDATPSVDFAICPLLAGPVVLEVIVRPAYTKGGSTIQNGAKGVILLNVV